MAAVRNRGGEAAATERAAQSEREFAEGDENEDGDLVWSRRGIVGASVVAALAGSVSWSCEPAQAFSLGICKVGLTHHGCKVVLFFILEKCVCVFPVFCGDTDCGSSGYTRVSQGFSKHYVQ